MLTDKKIQSLKPRDKDYKVFDGEGLFLLVKTSGAKYWRFKYRVESRTDGEVVARVEKLLALGTYPEVSLPVAREKKIDARRLLAQGIDPVTDAKAKAEALRPAPAPVLVRQVAEEWFALRSMSWSASHKDKNRSRLDRHVLPRWGTMPAAEVRFRHLLDGLVEIQARGTLETAHRVAQMLDGIFRLAIKKELAVRNPADGITRELTPWRGEHYPVLREFKDIGELLRRIDAYKGSPEVWNALRIAPYVFVRPGELRKARKDEFNLEDATWVIPAARMKNRLPHLVPLVPQVVALLREVMRFNEGGELLFPGRTSRRPQPISENTLGVALRGMGYTGETFVPHSFRATASTALNEAGWNRDWVERQLSHVEKNKVRAAYNLAEWRVPRTKMMLAWAEALDLARAGKAVQAPAVLHRRRVEAEFQIAAPELDVA